MSTVATFQKLRASTLSRKGSGDQNMEEPFASQPRKSVKSKKKPPEELLFLCQLGGRTAFQAGGGVLVDHLGLGGLVGSGGEFAQ